MSDNRLIRTGAAMAVLLVAAIAAVISYVHIEHLAVTHGQSALASALLPLSIDGTVAAASLVMLRAARAGLGTPWLARTMLVLAVAATLAANVAYGAPYGMTGALLSGWPAGAFIGCAEMALGMVRRARAVIPDSAPAMEISSVLGTVPADVIEAAKTSLAATIAAGNPLSQNQLMERFGLSRAQAAKVRQDVTTVANGQAATEAVTR